MRGWSIGVLAAAALLITGCNTTAPKQPEKQWRKADYAAATRVKDDALSPSIVVTSGGPKQAPVHPAVHQNDLRLMATHDKRTGRQTLAVVLRVVYSGPAWFHLSSASYVGADGIGQQGENFARGYSHVSSCSRGSCVFEEHAAFAVSGDELKAVVDSIRSGRRQSAWWPVRFMGSGERLDFVMHVDEVEGFLDGLAANTRPIDKPV